MVNINKPPAMSSESHHEGLVEPTEDVVGEFKRISDDCEGTLHTDQDRQEAFTTLHGVLDKFENHEVKVMYDEGRMPTFDSLEHAAKAASDALLLERDPHAIRIGKLLLNQVATIKRWCRQYVGALLRFRTSKSAFLRMNDEERRDALVKSDHDRRRIHDALLGSLASLQDLLRQGDEYAEFSPPVFWEQNDALPEGTASHANLIFAPETLGNRDFIRDWAIVADRIEEIRKVTGHTEPAPK